MLFGLDHPPDVLFFVGIVVVLGVLFRRGGGT